MSQNPYAAPRAEIQAPTAIEVGKRPLATRGQRFYGYIVDLAVLLVGAPVLLVIILTILDTFYPAYLEMPDTPILSAIESIVFLLVVSFVFLSVNGYLLVKRGQTVGKLVAKTQILSEEDELVPCLKIFLLRYLFFWFLGMLPGLGRLLSLGNSLAIFRGNRKCWHDQLAGTKVVMLRTPPHHRDLPDKINIPEI